MSKFTFEEKLEAVQRVISGEMGSLRSARILGVNYSCVDTWVRLYKEHGPQSLENYGGSYSGEFKIMVVKYKQTHDMSCCAVAAKFGIKNHSTVGKWEKIYNDEGAEGLLKRRKPRGKSVKSRVKNGGRDLSEMTNEELIREINHLRMENDYLKKLRALVQARMELENGKKQ